MAFVNYFDYNLQYSDSMHTGVQYMLAELFIHMLKPYEGFYLIQYLIFSD